MESITNCRSIIKNYIFSIREGDDKIIIDHLTEIKENTIAKLDIFKKSCNNKILLEKIEKVQASVKVLACDVVDDEIIKRFLTVSQLKAEINEYREVQDGR